MEDLVVYEGVDLEGGEPSVGGGCGEEEEGSWGWSVSKYSKMRNELERRTNRRRGVVFAFWVDLCL